MAREINLVPDIKNEMIKTLKLRNFIFFLCIIIASASVAVTFIFGVIVGGQSIAINGKTELLQNLSSKLNSYSDLNEFLTIKDQVGNIASITENKTLTSRTFNILSALIPTGPDTIQISELKISLEEDAPVYTFDAQANAGQAPYIDYNVLDSFKKSMAYMRYDYGNYVDKDGNTIPAYCMIEKDPSGVYFLDPESKGMYAYWTIFAEGCNNFSEEELKTPSKDDNKDNKDNKDDDQNTQNNQEENTNNTNNNNNTENLTSIAGYDLEDYEGTKVVRVWRTPQASWYKVNPKVTDPYMNENGEISNVAHFESKCIKYNIVIKNKVVTKIDDTTNSCNLVLGDTDDDRIQILESSNGRDASEQLVLRFSASLTLAPEVYDFNNAHLIAVAPSKRRNVTDSYVQLQSIFGERAKDCQEGDTACNGGSN